MKLLLRILGRKHVRRLIIVLVLDALVFSGSNSKTASSLMLAVAFVLLLATIYYFFYGVLAILRFYGIRFKRQNRFALYFTAVLGVLIALQSIGELSSRDIAVLLPLAGIAYLYSSYGSKLYNVNHGSK